MARFAALRPSRFFARSAKSSESTTNTSSRRSSSHYTDGPANDSRNASSLALPQPSPHQQPQQTARKRSSSITKLRERFLGGPDVPESVEEQRESVFELQHPHQLEEPAAPRRSGSETLAGRSPGESSLQKEEEPIVTELKLDDLEQVRSNPPAVVLEEPTPGVEEVLEGQEGQQSPAHGERTELIPSATNDDKSAPLSSAPVSPTTRPADTAHRLPTTANASDIKQTVIDAPSRRSHHQPSDSLPSVNTSALPTSAVFDYFTPGLPNMSHLLHRKIWVRRPGASATLVQIKEDDLVDDVREMILRKYKNSLGGTFDAPDMTLRIIQRTEEGSGQTVHERLLGPEEEMCRTIDSCYPGGQKVEEALVIDVPTRERRTPRPSPRAMGGYGGHHMPSYQALDDYRPLENGNDYFPPMPAVVPASMPQTSNSHDGRLGSTSSHAHHPSIVAGMPGALEPHQRSISVLNTGQLPPLPSPGGTIRERQRMAVGHREHGRPRYARQHTSSPTIVQHPAGQHPPGVNVNAGAVAVGGSGVAPPSLNVNPQHPLVHRNTNRPREGSLADGHVNGNSGLAPVNTQQAQQQPPPTPPASDALAPVQGGSTPPTPSSAVASTHSLRPGGRPRKGAGRKAGTPDKPTSGSRPRHARDDSHKNGQLVGNGNGAPSLSSSVLDGSVPPINVLIVEDNIINLRILEGLMKRLRVRWQTAMNGQIAVDKWRRGGYHLVLMDIQMPVMNGLQATKEIRRLERTNGIGVFSAEESQSPAVEKIKKMGDVEEVDPNPPVPSEEQINGEAKGKKREEDRLSLNEGLFKSPVIIVALTASSLQSDRHEALAAGCNDFLTKPVNFVWLERKVKEWGCMQALIDFDGWRKWKEFAAREEEGKTDEQREAERLKAEKEKRRMEKMAILQEKQRVKKEEEEREREKERRRKRASVQSSEVGTSATTANGGEGSGIANDGVSASEG